jgi:hypothetical protein
VRTRGLGQLGARLIRIRDGSGWWDRVEDYPAVADRPDCDIEPSDVIVIRCACPRCYPGMPEIANVALPARLLTRDVRDREPRTAASVTGGVGKRPAQARTDTERCPR